MQMVQKPQANASMTYVRSTTTLSRSAASGALREIPNTATRSRDGTSEVRSDSRRPRRRIQRLKTWRSLAAAAGFSYGSFLLGRSTSFGIGAPVAYKFGRQQYAMVRSRTPGRSRGSSRLDYGIRYDWGGYPRETYGRIASFDPQLANPERGWASRRRDL